MQKSAIVIVVLVALVALGLFGAAQMKKKQGNQAASQAMQQEEARAIPVSAVAVVPRNMDEKVEVTGTLKPADEVTVGTRVAGRVKWIIGKSGTRVRQGDLVASMEDDDARAQVRSADALVVAAAARVEQARAALDQQDTTTDTGISSAQAAYSAALARVEQAKAAAAQQVTSTSSGITSAQANVSAARARLTQAQTTADATEATVTAQVKSAEAGLTAAKARLAALQNGARSQEVLVAKNAIDLAQATYDNDKVNYARYQMLFEQKAVAKSLLDSAETKLKISQAQLDSARQQYDLVKTGARQEDIDAAKAGVDQAQEGLNTAKANLKQIDVANSNVEIAHTGVEQANAALLSAKSAEQVDIMRDKDVLAAKAAVEQAAQALRAAKAGQQTNRMRRSDVLSALAAEQQARETRTLALQALDNMEIYSPVSGVVAQKIVDVGQSVGSNAEVLTIATDQSLFFEADISELEATRLHAGQPVEISVDAMQGDRTNLYTDRLAKVVTGSVEKVVPVVNERTRNFTVRIVVPKSPALFPGMFTRGEIIVRRHTNVVAVPKEAVVSKGDRQAVFTIAGGKAKQNFVTTGATDGAYIQVLSGLMPGERIITVGQQTLIDNDRVADTPTPSAPKP